MWHLAYTVRCSVVPINSSLWTITILILGHNDTPFTHSAVCLTTGPQPLPKRVLHKVRSSASSFNFQYLRFSLRSSSSCLRLIPRLPVISILPSNVPSITCFRRQFPFYDAISEFESIYCKNFFLVSETSRPATGPMQPPVQCVPTVFFQGVKVAGARN